MSEQPERCKVDLFDSVGAQIRTLGFDDKQLTGKAEPCFYYCQAASGEKVSNSTSVNQNKNGELKIVQKQNFQNFSCPEKEKRLIQALKNPLKASLIIFCLSELRDSLQRSIRLNARIQELSDSANGTNVPDLAQSPAIYNSQNDEERLIKRRFNDTLNLEIKINTSTQELRQTSIKVDAN